MRFFDMDLPVHTLGESIDERREPLLLTAETSRRKYRSKPVLQEALLILILFTFDLCNAHEATLANRNP